MITRAGWPVLTLALLAALAPQTRTAAGPDQAPAASARTREDAWRADLETFAREFPAAQKDFATLYPRAPFDAGLAALTRALAASSDADVILALMRLVASAHVAHTIVHFPTTGPMAFHRLPLALQWFSDGLLVTGASQPNREALGLRVTSIGALTPAQLESAVAPYFAHEHEAWLHQHSPTFMVMEELLRRLGQVDADGRVTVALARADGTTVALRVMPGPWVGGPPLLGVIEALGIPPGPSRTDLARYYRYEILPGANALYVRYSRCTNDPQQPFANFARDLFAAVAAAPSAIERVVIDLRSNTGGDSRIIKPLLDGLRARRSLSARGRLYALIGPSTFSSGLMAAVSLRDLKAVLVGETPGEKLDTYGEVRPLTLPNSRLVVQYSTKHFKLAKGDSPTLDPDVVVRRSIADLLAGHDPVLDAALTQSPRR